MAESHPELLGHLTDGDAAGGGSGGRGVPVGYARLLAAEHCCLHGVFDLQAQTCVVFPVRIERRYQTTEAADDRHVALLELELQERVLPLESSLVANRVDHGLLGQRLAVGPVDRGIGGCVRANFLDHCEITAHVAGEDALDDETEVRGYFVVEFQEQSLQLTQGHHGRHASPRFDCRT